MPCFATTIVLPGRRHADDEIWTNATEFLAKNRVDLGWFGRPCSHIMASSTTSASMDCPSKKIHKGYPQPCTLRNLSDPCTMASMATVDTLVKRGVKAFYWCAIFSLTRTFAPALSLSRMCACSFFVVPGIRMM